MVDYLEPVLLIAEIRNKLNRVAHLAYENKVNDIRFWLDDGLSDEIIGFISVFRGAFYEEAQVFERHIRHIVSMIGVDNSLAADLIITRLMPLLERCMKTLANIDIIDESEGLQLLSTRSGYLTIKDIKKGVYLHSLVDPREEARIIAENLYNPEYTQYIFLGSGLGYLPYEIYEKSEQSAQIFIFEKSENLVRYAWEYGVLDKIDSSKLNVLNFDQVEDFIDYVSDKKCIVYLFEATLDRELSFEEIEKISDLRLRLNTSRSSKELLRINLYKNRENGCKSIENIKDREKDKTAIVIAAGPSLDMHLKYLKENNGKKTLIAVGTVFSKLIQHGIKPDYVVVADPRRRTMQQIRGLEHYKIPLVMAAVAYWGFSEVYSGDKYLIYPKGCHSDIENIAKKENIPLFITGGSVVSFAIETAIYLGAKKVEFAGVDLSYPNGKSHTDGTMHSFEIPKQATEKVDCVDGGKVYTTPALKSYIRDVENQIGIHREVEFINLSKIGAKIKGAV